MELKPCPFCGEEAVLKRKSSNFIHVGSSIAITDNWVVVCKNGCCKMNEYRDYIFHKSDGEIVIGHNGAEEAVNDWNRRATE